MRNSHDSLTAAHGTWPSRTHPMLKLARSSNFVLVVCVFLQLCSCALPGPADNRDSRYSFKIEALELEPLEKAVRSALISDGFQDADIKHFDAENLAGHLGRTIGRDGGTATKPLGVEAVVDYFKEPDGSLLVCLHVPHSGIVSMAGRRRELCSKLKNQIKLELNLRDSVARSSLGSQLVPNGGGQQQQSTLPPFTGIRHALIIGISDYQDASFTYLPRAEGDARAVRDLLQSEAGGRLAPERVRVLINEQATRPAIIQQLQGIAQTSREGDLMIVYFAGHALARNRDGDRYFMPYDALADNPLGTGLERSDIVKILDRARAKRQVVFLDSCFSGEEVRAAPDFMESNPFDSMQSDAAQASYARAIITSTEGGETALDSMDGSENSPFCTFLLRALSGDRDSVDKDGDAILTTQELSNYLYQHVSSAAAEKSFDMHPQLYGAPDLPVFTLLE